MNSMCHIESGEVGGACFHQCAAGGRGVRVSVLRIPVKMLKGVYGRGRRMNVREWMCRSVQMCKGCENECMGAGEYVGA